MNLSAEPPSPSAIATARNARSPPSACPARRAVRAASPRCTHARHAPSGKPAQAEGVSAILAPETNRDLLHLYHKLNWSLLALTPLAFIMSPSPINMPVDWTLAVLFPLHAHFGMNSVIYDYVPKFIGTR